MEGKTFKIIPNFTSERKNVVIKDRFKKLALSTYTKRIPRPESPENTKENLKKSLFDDSLISEDESEDEKMLKPKNRVLISSSDYNSSPATSVKILNVKSPEFIDVENTPFDETFQNGDETNAFLNMTGRLSLPFSHKLRFSDSDATNCSEVSNDSFKSTLDDESILGTQMSKLEISESEQSKSLFSKSTDETTDSSMRKFIRNNKIVENLSSQLLVMDLKLSDDKFSDLTKLSSVLNQKEEEVGPLVLEDDSEINENSKIDDQKTFFTNTTLSNENLSSFDLLERSSSDKLFSSEEPSNEEIISISKFRSSLGVKKTSQIIEDVKDANDSILTISSTDSYDSQDVSGEQENSEVVIISDSELEESFHNVSTVHSTTIPDNNPDSIPNTLLNNFFDNIPLLVNTEKISNQKEKETENNESFHTEESIEIPSSSIDEFNEESIEIPSSSIEEEQHKPESENIPSSSIEVEHKPESENIPSSDLEKKSNEVKESQSTQLTKKFIDSNTFVESINISAKIKLKLKFSQLDSSDSTNDSINDSKNDSSKKDESSDDESIKSPITVKKSDKKNSPMQKVEVIKTPLKKVEKSDNKKSPTQKEELFKTPLKQQIKPDKKIVNKNICLKTPLKEPAKDEFDNLEIDESMQAILNDVYGKSWQTPDILRKCTTTRKDTKKNNPDFSIFDRSLSCDLESTRVDIPKKIVPVVNSPYFKGGPSKTLVEKTKQIIKPRTPIAAKRRAAINARQKYNEILDSDTDSDFSSNEGSDDNSMQSSCPSSEEEEEEEEEDIPTPIVKNIKKKIILKDANGKESKRKSRIIFDFVEVIETDSEEDEVFEKEKEKESSELTQRTKIFLDSCEFKKKSQIKKIDEKNEAPVKITKRKLFTPRYDDIEICPEPAPDRKTYQPRKSSVDQIAPDFLIPAIFKPIEAIKRMEIKKPEKKQTIKSVEEPRVFKTPKPKIVSKSLADFGTEKPSPSVKTDKNYYNFLHSLDVRTSENVCHPDALYYRQNYKTKKGELANKLYDLYNDKVFDKGLNLLITWNNKLLNTAGRCHNKRKGQVRSSAIELSDKVLTGPDRLRCTLIHEMCHAATWIYNGENGHGKTWKAWAAKSNAIFPELPKIGVCHSYNIEYKYTYKCVLCNAKSHAHSRSKKVEKIRCSYCHGAIEIFLNKKNKDGDIVTTPAKKATGFAKFVQEKYKQYKAPNLKHGDVMKLLGNAFGSMSVDEKIKY